VIHLEPGEVLFEEGSRGGLIYVVESGEIEVVRQRTNGREDSLAVYGRNEYFGELGPLLGFARAGTARARKRTVLTGFTVTEFRDRVGADKVTQILGKASTRTPRKKPARKSSGKTSRPRKRKP
jgi:putative ABC transport system ATP-binding protein